MKISEDSGLPCFVPTICINHSPMSLPIFTAALHSLYRCWSRTLLSCYNDFSVINLSVSICWIVFFPSWSQPALLIGTAPIVSSIFPAVSSSRLYSYATRTALLSSSLILLFLYPVRQWWSTRRARFSSLLFFTKLGGELSLSSR